MKSCIVDCGQPWWRLLCKRYFRGKHRYPTYTLIKHPSYRERIKFHVLLNIPLVHSFYTTISHTTISYAFLDSIKHAKTFNSSFQPNTAIFTYTATLSVSRHLLRSLPMLASDPVSPLSWFFLMAFQCFPTLFLPVPKLANMGVHFPWKIKNTPISD